MPCSFTTMAYNMIVKVRIFGTQILKAVFLRLTLAVRTITCAKATQTAISTSIGCYT